MFVAPNIVKSVVKDDDDDVSNNIFESVKL